MSTSANFEIERAIDFIFFSTVNTGQMLRASTIGDKYKSIIILVKILISENNKPSIKCYDK